MSQKRPKLEFDKEEDDESFQCTFCLDNWKNKGDHRLISLNCGHLFGERYKRNHFFLFQSIDYYIVAFDAGSMKEQKSIAVNKQHALFARKIIHKKQFYMLRFALNRKQIKLSQIRNVQPVKLVVQDTSSIDKLTKELDAIKTQIKEQQNALELSKLALSLCQRELAKAKKESF